VTEAAIGQRPGDFVYIPAGYVHQVLNLRSCLNFAMDVVPAAAMARTMEHASILGEYGLPDKLQTELVLASAAMRVAKASD
jgi:hypothetical protein